MTISKVKPSGWGLGEKLTSGQISQVDTNVTYALDKRSGQTDSLASLVSLATGGRLVMLVQNGTDSNSTYQIANGQIVRIPTNAFLTAERTYTLSSAGALDGDMMIVEELVDPAFPAPNSYSVVVASVTAADPICRVGGSAARSVAFRFDASLGHWCQAAPSPNILAAEMITSTSTWTVPPDVASVVLIGCGGGGGGGGGGGHGAGLIGFPGAGGGAALVGTCTVDVSGNPSVLVTIGTGGAGGAAGVTGNDGGDGGDGGDTTFGAIATFRGAQKGTGGYQGHASPLNAPGGGPCRVSGFANPRTATAPVTAAGPGWGGYGCNLVPGLRIGGGSTFAAGGAVGTDTGGAFGGGGGGASNIKGAVAGVGGASSTGSGVAGGNGTAGTLGSGGGGGGGSWSAGGASGGAGGAGGNGALIVIYAR